MELRGLAAQGRDPDRVLEESAGVAVVTVRSRRGKRAESGADRGVAHERVHDRRQPGMCDLSGEKFEEAVQLVGVAPEGRRQLRRIGVVYRLDRPHLDLKPAPEALDPSEHAHGVPLREPLVEELDVAPHARLDASACIGELEREIRSACPRPAALLLGDREHAFDGPVLGELGDRGHGLSLRARAVGTLAAMADLQPFRAVRYAGAAGPLGNLVAPPYDAVTRDERARLYTRSLFNVVHLTLPESADEAGRLYREWLSEGILVREDEPAAWLLVEDYLGPNGVARDRRGVIVSVAVEPYETGSVLPHERTHPRIREERLRLLRATRVQPEPIFLLLDQPLEVEVPERLPDLEADGSRLWRLRDFDLSALARGGILIADGHHRYESALELGAELDASGARIMALLVSTKDPGLRVFPTHRVFSGRADLAELREGELCESLDDALRRLTSETFARSAAVAYRRGRVELLRGHEGQLDVELVDRHGLDGIAYTQQVADAVAAVEDREADVAFLLREPRVEDVFAVARRGERMPPKSTYFFPKPLSGLLFHPVEA